MEKGKQNGGRKYEEKGQLSKNIKLKIFLLQRILYKQELGILIR